MITKCAGAPSSTRISRRGDELLPALLAADEAGEADRDAVLRQPERRLAVASPLRGRAASRTRCGRSSSGSLIGKRAATSRSIAIAASPQRSMNEAIERLRRSRPSPASAERRCQTTFAPWRRATQAAASSGESFRCTSGKRCVAHQPRRAGAGAAAARRSRGRGRASAAPRTASPRRARRSRRRRCGRSRRRRRRAPPPAPPGRRRAARSAGRGGGSAARATTARRRAAGGGGRRGSGSARARERSVGRSPRSGARSATGRSSARRARARRAPSACAALAGRAAASRPASASVVDAEVVDEHARLAGDDDAAAGARAGRDDRHAARRRLDHRPAELRPLRRRDDDVGGLVEVGGVLRERDEADDVVEVELVDELLRLGLVVARQVGELEARGRRRCGRTPRRGRRRRRSGSSRRRRARAAARPPR